MMAAACLLRPRKADWEAREKGEGRSGQGSGEQVDGETRRRGDAENEESPRVPVSPCPRVFAPRSPLPVAALLLCLIVAWGLHSDSFLSGLRFTDTPAMRFARGGTGRLRHVSLAAPAGRVRDRGGRAGGDQPVVGGNGHPLAPRRAEFLRHPSRGGRSPMEHAPVDARHHEPRSAESRSRASGTNRRDTITAPDRWERIFDAIEPRRPLAEVGVLGLGAGTIAAYAEPGERFTFYEIDPAVERIARNPDYFTYLADCRGKVEVILGDARLSLEREPERQFDLLIVDVYSSDSVPVHLTTREALKIYFDHLTTAGAVGDPYFQPLSQPGAVPRQSGRGCRADGADLAGSCRGGGPGMDSLGLGRDGPQPRRSWSAGRRSSLAARWSAIRGRFGPTISPMSPRPCSGNRTGCN